MLCISYHVVTKVQFKKSQSILQSWQMFTEPPGKQTSCTHRTQFEHHTYSSIGFFSLNSSQQNKNGFEQAPHSLTSAFPLGSSWASEVTHSLSWHSTWKFKPHTRQNQHLPLYPSLRLLWSKSKNTSLPERGFSTGITLELYFAQSHCARITQHGYDL